MPCLFGPNRICIVLATPNDAMPANESFRSAADSSGNIPEQQPAPQGDALRELLAHIVASTSDAIFSRKLDGTVISWNEAAERIFGYTADHMLGRSSAILLPQERRHELPAMMARIRRGERIDHFETIRIRADGRPITISICVSPVWDGRGQVIGSSSIARDITDQRRLEKELLQISERERRRLGRDLHDGLGQQLGGMELLCRTLERRLEAKGIPEAATAQLLVEQIRETLEQTRALARGLTPIWEEPTGLMLALEDLAETTRKLYGVICVFQCQQPVVIEDHSVAVHLFRIAQESISNAVRHGRATHIYITLQRLKDNIVLRIRDNGQGLPTEKEPHKGMGLQIMKYRTSVVGGHLRVDSIRPHGVQVACTVPLATTRG